MAIPPVWRTGEVIRLKSLSDRPLELRVLLEWRGDSSFAFALPESPYQRLRVAKDRSQVTFATNLDVGRFSGGREAAFSVLRHPCPDIADAPPCGHVVSLSFGSKSHRVYLAPRAEEPGHQLGSALLQLLPSEADRDEATVSAETRPWTEDLCLEPSFLWEAVAEQSEAPDYRPEAFGALDTEALEYFAREGFLHLRRVVPEDVRTVAKAFINAKLAEAIFNPAPKGEAASADDDFGARRREHFFAEDGERLADPAGNGERGALHKAFGAASAQLMGLLQCAPVMRVVEQLVGEGKVDYRCGAQVALRFPGVHDDLVAGGAAVRTKVTGRDWHTDGLRQGKKHSFSVLVGIPLSDCLEEDSGNLCVWPGSHMICHAKMRDPDGQIRREAGWEPKDGPLPDLGPPSQLRVESGDVILAHSELAHCGGPHLGSDIYMVYFRVRHVDWLAMREASALVENMWVDLEGLASIRKTGRLPQTPAVDS